MLGIVKPVATAVTQNAIPEYLREQAPNMVAFLKHYYEWMAKDGNVLDFLQNMVEYRDIGTVSDDKNSTYFTGLIINQLADFIPATSNINRALFVSHIRDFYKSKGTLPSYEFILNALFNSTASIVWNSDKVLRPSSNNATRDASLFTYSTTPWDATANGSIITQTYPTVASAVIDLCTPTIVNGKIVNALDLDPDSVVGTFSTNGNVKVLKNTVDRSYVYVDTYYTLVSYNPTNHNMVVSIDVEPSRQYTGLIVKQIGSNFRAVIQTFVSRVLVNNRYQLTGILSNVTGTLGTGDIYAIASSVENNVFTKADYLTGTVSSSVTDINIINGGSLNDTGDIIEYVGGSGSPMTAKIYSIGGGAVDAIIPITTGYGYAVGDKLSFMPIDGMGGGLSAHVSNIDGINANITTLTELDGINIRDGGHSFFVGDLITIQGGTSPIQNSPTVLRVTSINSNLALNRIQVVHGGTGYNYTRAMMINRDTNTVIPNFAANVSSQYGIITTVDITQYPTLTSQNAYVIINGNGATITTSMTANMGISSQPFGAAPFSGDLALTTTGIIQTVQITNGGFNYINPKVVVHSASSPIRPASFSISMDANGTITNVAVVDGGLGYPDVITLEIVEMFGSGVMLNTVINAASGPVTGLQIVDRGTYTTLPKCFESSYTATSLETIFSSGVSSNGFSSGPISGGPVAGGAVVVSNNSVIGLSSGAISSGPFGGGTLSGVTIPSGSVSTTLTVPSSGADLIVDLKYRVKNVVLASPGSYYRQPIINTSYGIGQDAQFIPQIANGVIKTVPVSQGGTGYTRAQVGIIGTGVGFKGVVNLLPVGVVNTTDGMAISSAPFSDNAIGGNSNIVSSFNYVASITIIDGGIGYTGTDQVVIYGDGVGAVASLTTVDGVVKQIIVYNGGKNYAYDTTFNYVMNPVQFPSAVAGTFTPVIADGVIKAVNIIDGGSGYSLQTNDLKNEDGTYILMQDASQIAFNSPYDVPNAVGGTPAIATISAAGKGGILSAEVVYGGSGYYSITEVPPLEIYVNSTIGYGAVVAPVLEHGKLFSYKILSSGSGYLTTDTISIVGGVGSGAAMTPVFNGGKLSSIIITNAGNGYKYGTSALVVGNGKNADVYVDVNTSITQIDVVSGGTGYINPTIFITDSTGAGYGASATAAIKDGVIVGINVVSGGTGYVNPVIQLADTSGTGIGAGHGAVLNAIITRYIEGISVVNSGQDYTFAEVFVVGDGTGANINLHIEKNGSIANPSLSYGGTGYVDTPSFGITDISGYGALTAVKILDGGSQFVKAPIISIPDKYVGNSLVATGATFVSWGQNIGTVTGVQMTQFGGDWYEAPKFNFSVHTVMENNVDFVEGEKVIVANFPYTLPDNSFSLLLEDVTQFQGYIIGNILYVTNYPSGSIEDGSLITGNGVAVGTHIVQQLTGIYNTNQGLSAGAIGSGAFSGVSDYIVGGFGTYQLNISQTIPSGNMTATHSDDGWSLFGEYKLRPLSQEVDNASSIMTEDGLEIIEEDTGFIEEEFYEITNMDGTLSPYFDKGPSAIVNAVDFATNTLELGSATDSLIIISETGDIIMSESGIPMVDQTSDGISIGDVLVGTSSQSKSTILWFNRASGVATIDGVGFTKKSMQNSTGVLNHPLSMLQDGARIQDYAYVIRTGASLNQYKDVLTRNVHPAGYQMYGDVVLGTFGGNVTVSAPKTFGVKGADSSFFTTVNIKNAFVNMNTNHNKNLWYYNTTKQYFYTTQGALFSGYTFNNYDINSIDFITNHTPLATIEPWYAKTFQFTGASCTTGSGHITGITNTAGVNLGYRVIAYNALGANIFIENKLELEDLTRLLNEDSTFLETDEPIVTVTSLDTVSIIASKNVGETDNGTVTIAIQNIPSLRLA